MCLRRWLNDDFDRWTPVRAAHFQALGRVNNSVSVEDSALLGRVVQSTIKLIQD